MREEQVRLWVVQSCDPARHNVTGLNGGDRRDVFVDAFLYVIVGVPAVCSSGQDTVPSRIVLGHYPVGPSRVERLAVDLDAVSAQTAGASQPQSLYQYQRMPEFCSIVLSCSADPSNSAWFALPSDPSERACSQRASR